MAGVATGGKNREENWKAFQRHRFVAMNNGTQPELVPSAQERHRSISHSQAAPTSSLLQARGRLGPWVDSWATIGFVDLMCDHATPEGGCNYTEPYFSLTPGLAMPDQFACKYLPDIDGNSFSGRYLSFLRSSSLPIKATVWHEWHDSRLVAWKHFIPMDNRYTDWYGIIEYFLGYGGSVRGHDSAAERIASDGKEWTEKVLRKEDMQIYVLRLLLEYARLSDERRDFDGLGWRPRILSLTLGGRRRF